MKPLSKQEARWKFWRDDRPWLQPRESKPYVKREMRRARRRHYKIEDANALSDLRI